MTRKTKPKPHHCNSRSIPFEMTMCSKSVFIPRRVAEGGYCCHPGRPSVRPAGWLGVNIYFNGGGFPISDGYIFKSWCQARKCHVPFLSPAAWRKGDIVVTRVVRPSVRLAGWASTFISMVGDSPSLMGIFKSGMTRPGFEPPTS